jgi:hypothetical protein
MKRVQKRALFQCDHVFGIVKKHVQASHATCNVFKRLKFMIEGTLSLTFHSFFKLSPSSSPMLDGMLGSSLVFVNTFTNILVDRTMTKNQEVDVTIQDHCHLPLLLTN